MDDRESIFITAVRAIRGSLILVVLVALVTGAAILTVILANQVVAIAAIVSGALIIRFVVRRINRRDDPQYVRRPPDPP